MKYPWKKLKIELRLSGHAYFVRTIDEQGITRGFSRHNVKWPQNQHILATAWMDTPGSWKWLFTAGVDGKASGTSKSESGCRTAILKLVKAHEKRMHGSQVGAFSI